MRLYNAGPYPESNLDYVLSSASLIFGSGCVDGAYVFRLGLAADSRGLIAD